MLLKHLSALCYLARQGLAIWGHEEREGNMIQLLRMWSAQDADMKEWLREGNYLSEQIKMMADQVLRHLLSEIRGAKFFSILADEPGWKPHWSCTPVKDQCIYYIWGIERCSAALHLTTATVQRTGIQWSSQVWPPTCTWSSCSL